MTTFRDGDGGRYCNKCGEFKPFDQLVPHSVSKYGYQQMCRLCSRAIAKNIYRKTWRKKRISVIKYQRTERGKEAKARAAKNFQQKYPHKAKAHSAVRYALKTGKLIRPSKCTDCLQEAKLDAHHDDHLKPLDVVWLCRACHHNRHNHLIDERKTNVVYA